MKMRNDQSAKQSNDCFISSIIAEEPDRNLQEKDFLKKSSWLFAGR